MKRSEAQKKVGSLLVRARGGLPSIGGSLGPHVLGKSKPFFMCNNGLNDRMISCQ